MSLRRLRQLPPRASQAPDYVGDFDDLDEHAARLQRVAAVARLAWAKQEETDRAVLAWALQLCRVADIAT